MDRQAIKQDLTGLNKEEAFALYYTKCRGVLVSQVSKDANRSPNVSKMSPGTVSNRAVQALRYLRLDDVQQGSELCIAFQELVDLLKRTQNGEETIDWSLWPPQIELDEGGEAEFVSAPSEGKGTVSPSQAQVSEQSTPVAPPEQTSSINEEWERGESARPAPENFIQNVVNAIREGVATQGLARSVILAALILLLVLGAFLIGRFFETDRGPLDTDLRGTPNQVEIAEATSNSQSATVSGSPEPITAVDSNGAATDEALAVEGTLTAVAENETAIAFNVTPDVPGTEMAFQAVVDGTLTAVAEAATAAIPTSTPTNTPSPTATLTPTPSFTPTATPLFEDNFDNGLSPAWQVISGEPIVSNGRLTANKETWLAVGDSSWTNYVVKFRRVSDQVSGGCSTGNVIAFRVQDIDNYISYFWHFCESGFQVKENGSVTNIPGGTGNTRDWHDFTFTINGGQYEARLNNVTRTYFDTRYTNGGIILKLKNNTVIDDFIVMPIAGEELP